MQRVVASSREVSKQMRSVGKNLTALRMANKRSKSDEKILSFSSQGNCPHCSKSTYAVHLQCNQGIDVFAFPASAAHTLLDSSFSACMVVKQRTAEDPTNYLADKLHDSSHAANLCELSVE